jgi:hypothetical protein
LITPGDQTLTVTDTVANTLTGSANVTVTDAAPRGSSGPAHGVPGAARTFRGNASQPAPVLTSPATLRAFVTEWTRTDDDYATRVAHLLGSSGVPPLLRSRNAGRKTLGVINQRVRCFAPVSIGSPNERYEMVNAPWRSVIRSLYLRADRGSVASGTLRYT